MHGQRIRTTRQFPRLPNMMLRQLAAAAIAAIVVFLPAAPAVAAADDATVTAGKPTWFPTKKRCEAFNHLVYKGRGYCVKLIQGGYNHFPPLGG